VLWLRNFSLRIRIRLFNEFGIRIRNEFRILLVKSSGFITFHFSWWKIILKLLKWRFRTRVSTKVLFLLSTKSKFRQNYSLISLKFRCFDFLKFRFRCRNRNSDFGFDFDIGISVSISTPEFRFRFRFRLRNTDFDVGTRNSDYLSQNFIFDF
jgi:hypothetical protein